jgi:2,3,4,5-tetrahydropyridine-2,6-dicarboxylate N-succinyltransferase
MSQSPQSIIEQAWENRTNLSPESAPADVRSAVNTVLEGLNNGSIRVAERRGVGQWEVNQWVKKAVLLSFRLEDNKPMAAGGYTSFMTRFLANSNITQQLTLLRVVLGWFPQPSLVEAHLSAKMLF